ncbi:MAG: dihydrofolate reductase [Herbinix sp.]|nr:dihydrofolate reductase [Herbinix sp.]
MRKLILSVNMSLDGFVAGPNGEMDWIHADDELFNYIVKLTNQSDAAIYGRVTYQMMDAYWPTAAEQPNPSQHDIEHASWYNRVEKYVLSNTLTLSKPKLTILSGDIAPKVMSIKSQPGESILMFGSPSAAQSLIQFNYENQGYK